jgi:hypothetical protein
VLVRDNLNVHKDARLRAFIDTHDWITCYFLPAYAPDLNPVEGLWSLLRRSSQANTAFTDPDHLMRTYPPAWPPPDPIPQQPHRRMPRRNRPHLDDTAPTSSVVPVVPVCGLFFLASESRARTGNRREGRRRSCGGPRGRT